MGLLRLRFKAFVWTVVLALAFESVCMDSCLTLLLASLVKNRQTIQHQYWKSYLFTPYLDYLLNSRYVGVTFHGNEEHFLLKPTSLIRVKEFYVGQIH